VLCSRVLVLGVQKGKKIIRKRHSNSFTLTFPWWTTNGPTRPYNICVACRTFGKIYISQRNCLLPLFFCYDSVVNCSLMYALREPLARFFRNQKFSSFYLLKIFSSWKRTQKQFLFSRDPNWQYRVVHNFMKFNNNNFTSIVSLKHNVWGGAYPKKEH
jgi:hypothetical protein